MGLGRQWKLYVIHHSHTDIGYTDRQEKIERYHIEFIKQAIEISEHARSGAKPEWEGFRWTCETFWAVEKFLERTDSGWRARLEKALRAGDIGLSGTYLNMTELIDGDILARMTRRAVDFGKSIGVNVRSAMTADINGYSWGYAQAMVDAGIENLFSCVHTHHGMFPLFRKQIPFWWETPQGQRLLVWNGDHYHLGNELGIAPKALHSYMIRDEFSTPPIADHHWEIAETRIYRYVRKLEEERYPYSFVPVMVSGLITDNAPPNGAIMTLIKEWNKKYGDEIELEMVLLDQFFDRLRSEPAEIPVYRGDWPDWWADGVASTAAHTQLFRDAQRKFHMVKDLDPTRLVVKEETIREIENHLMLYAEHTWGYSASVTEPWNPLVQQLEFRKEAYAVQAHRLVCQALDDILQEVKHEVPLMPGRAMRFKVLNPHPVAVDDLAELVVDYWELPLLKNGLQVREEGTKTAVPHQVKPTSRGQAVCVPVHLEPGEEKIFVIQSGSGEIEGKTASSFRLAGADGVRDVWPNAEHQRELDPGFVLASTLETPYVTIRWKQGEGIISWRDKQTGKELISRGGYGAFTPIYEKTPVSRIEDAANVRTRMGRNRKGFHVERTAGRLKEIKRVSTGKLETSVQLLYEMPGVSYYCVELSAAHFAPMVKVSVRMHKDSVWDPENVYIALPFIHEEGEFWIEKTGAVLRPWIDQLPGTNTDFYCIQGGAAQLHADGGIVIAMPDTPLIHLGDLDYRPRRLHGQTGHGNGKPSELYSWVLNNFWETNFKAVVGGFYEFRYLLKWGSDIRTPDKAFQICKGLNNGLIAIRV